jgi:hypothetical protein
MTLSLVNRKTVRNGIVTLVTADGSWDVVLDHEPTPGELDGQFPAFSIYSEGTTDEDPAFNTTPTTFRFVATNFVLLYDKQDPDSWNANHSEDLLDDLNKALRDILRNNVPAGCDSADIVGGSRADWELIDGELYRVEDFTIHAVTHD